MEIRARYVLVGIFVLMVVAMLAGFTWWVRGGGGLAERTAYAVRFSGPINGLSPGSNVLFNGISVGEVTSLTLDSRKPSDVVVTISVDRGTPVRSDTRAGIAYSGLTGSGSIALFGGANTAAPIAPGNPPMITADLSAVKDLTEAARGTLGTVDKVIADNSDALRSAIASVDTFAQALARNASKVDQIISGLASLTGGGTPMNYALHDLPVPAIPPATDVPTGQLVVTRPTAVVALATQRLLILGPNGDAPVFDEVRWSDTLPLLIQARTIEAFEKSGYVKVVSDAGLASGEFQLGLDLRAFHLVPGAKPVAEVVIAAKLLNMDGKVVDGKSFSQSVPVAKTDDPALAIDAFSAAYGKVTTDLIAWTLATVTKAEAASPPDLGPAPPLAPDFPPLDVKPAPAPNP